MKQCIDFHCFSLLFIDCHWFSLIVVDLLWFSVFFIDLSLISLMLIDFHCLSLTSADSHTFSRNFIDFHWFSSILFKLLISLTLVDFHWFSWFAFTFCGFRRFSLFFVKSYTTSPATKVMPPLKLHSLPTSLSHGFPHALIVHHSSASQAFNLQSFVIDESRIRWANKRI